MSRQLITVEVVSDEHSALIDEVTRAIESREDACLEMPGWGSAPTVRLVALEITT